MRFIYIYMGGEVFLAIPISGACIHFLPSIFWCCGGELDSHLQHLLIQQWTVSTAAGSC